MDIPDLTRISSHKWRMPPDRNMRVPILCFASQTLLKEMDPDTFRQIRNVATLPGIVGNALVMPDAHRGYGFPIGGVAAFDATQGIISAGGVGFDISCGVRTLNTGLNAEDIMSRREELAEALFLAVPCGVGRSGRIILGDKEIKAMLRKGAKWAVDRGYGDQGDLDRTEELGIVAGAMPEHVSNLAQKRIRDQIGTLGAGNHYLEVQLVEEIMSPEKATAFGISKGDVLVSLHCGSRGLGHQIGTDYLKEMLDQSNIHGLHLPDSELACAPANSELGRRYLGAMRSGMNCALANRQTISHYVREAFDAVFPGTRLRLIYDVSHNTCKLEAHVVDGQKRKLLVHRKGATRALGPGHPSLPPEYRNAGQPVLVGGSMGTPSYILAGKGDTDSFASTCHGAGRTMSRSKAKKRFKSRDVTRSLLHQGIYVRGNSIKGIAEEAPGAYKNVTDVVQTTVEAGLTDIVARTSPMVCVKG